MLPNNSWSSEAVPAALLPPHNNPPVTRLAAQDAGPIALNDISQGLRARIWTATWNPANGEIRLDDGTLLTTVASLTELSLSFDQAGRPFLAYAAGGSVYIRWYDSSVSATVTTLIATGDQPFCHLDERRPEFVGESDVLLIYRRAGAVYYRRQRDRFLNELPTPLNSAGGIYIVAFGMAANNRMQVKYIPSA